MRKPQTAFQKRKDTTTAEAVSDTPNGVEESSQTDDSSQVEIIRDPELFVTLAKYHISAKCTVEGKFLVQRAMLSDYLWYKRNDKF